MSCILSLILVECTNTTANDVESDARSSAIRMTTSDVKSDADLEESVP